MTIPFLTSQVARYVSILGFIVALFLGYQQLPPEVPVALTPSSETATAYSKDAIFYVTAGVMLISNVLFLWMGRLFPKLPDGFIKLPGAIKWMFYRKQLNSIIREWMNFGTAVVNVLLGASIYILALINPAEALTETPTLMQFNWVLGAATFLLVLWAVYIPLRLLLTSPVKD